jgi:nucleotide-binding universal stress UspA family protein
MASPTFVVPLDSSAYSERALPVATSLAQRTGGRLLLVSVQDHGPLRPAEYLDEIARCPRPVPVETVGISDTYPADAIVKIVGESDDRIVCMTSHGRGGLRWGIVGSVAEEVVRRAERPTLLIGRHCHEDFFPAPNLLACVDGPESASRVAPAALDWAERLGLAVHAAVVVHPLDIESAEHPEVLLEPIVEQFGGPDHVKATMLTSRYPEGTLADYAAELPAAIIATNSHARTGLARFALGSTTMALLHQAPCPLLVTAVPAAEGRTR